MDFSNDQIKVITSRGKNLLVSAAAGSGKTAVLVERILSLITDEKDRTDLDRILVVTFTVAAAGEMKDRIGAALEKRLEADPENEYLQHQAVLIHHAQIGTIHSFCSYIIRNYFYRIDVDPVFRVMEEGERKLLFADVMKKVLEEKYSAKDPEFDFLVTNWFEKKTDAKLEEIIESLYDTAITTPWPFRWLQKAAADLDAEAESEEEEKQNQYCAPAVRALVSVTEELIRQFDAKKRDKGLCDFSDLEHLAMEILYEEDENGNIVRTDAAKELASRFRYVMTDEYQDSNLIQEAILEAVSGNKDGVFNRFMVGDVKQSIYGFRQARPDIFIEKYKEYPPEEEGRDLSTSVRIDLHTNYRSRREVIDTVNRVFYRLMTPELGGIEYDDKAALAYGDLYPKETPADNATEIIFMDRKSPDMDGVSASEARRIEALIVSERIRQIVGRMPVYDKDQKAYRPCRYSDIAVLFQVASGVADIFSKALTEQGIPNHSVSKEGYFSATEIVTVLNFLSILDNPIQDISFTAVLFSPIVDLSAEELAEIRSVDQETDYYHACLQYIENGPDGKLKEKLAEFMQLYASLRRKSVYTPVHELIRDIYDVTGYRNVAAAMPAGEQRAANLDMLVVKAKAYEKTSYHGLFNFIRYIERLKKYSMDEGEVNIYSDTADTVRLMSIHKSKGLEFPVVFLCDTSHSFNLRDVSGRFLFHPDLGIGLDACDVQKHRAVTGVRKLRIAEKKKEERYAENLRVLYVALTRAREKLFITAVEGNLEKIFKECAELNLNPEEPVPKKILMQYDRFSAWLILALYGCKDGFVRKTTETAISISDKLGKHRKSETGFFERLRDLDENIVYHEQVKKTLEEALAFRYPEGLHRGLPGKMTVTQLKRLNEEMSEEEQGEVFEKEPVVVPYLPAFEAGEESVKIQGAALGTIYHKVFEKIEYEKIRGEDKKAAEEYTEELLLSLVEKGFLNEKEAAAVRPQDIVRFLISPLGKRMKRAALRGLLKREQAFTFSIPANEADPAWPAEEDLLVQGIIDACFWEEEERGENTPVIGAETDASNDGSLKAEKDKVPKPGAYVVVDYKTDYVPDDGSSLVDKYGKQVYYYARALEAATGMKVKEKYIYSTFLGKSLQS